MFLKLKPICHIYYFLVLMKQQKCACGSSDVEKRLVGNFHQDSNIFPEWSQGRQCVSNALISILYKYLNLKEVLDWTSGDIDFILKNGDELYQHVCQYARHFYLNPCDLPNHFCFKNTLLRCFAFSGNISESFVENGPFLSLKSAISIGFF